MAFGKTFERVAPILMGDLIKELDLTPEQAAGFVGNFGKESGLVSGQQEGKPIGITAPIRGLLGGIDWPQWTGQGRTGRRKLFGDFVEARGLPYPAYSTSLAFVLHELRGDHKNALEAVRQTSTVKAAAETVGFHYEKFAGYRNLNSENYRERIRYAERALDLYLASQPDEPVTPAPIEPPVTSEQVRAALAIAQTISAQTQRIVELLEAALKEPA